MDLGIAKLDLDDIAASMGGDEAAYARLMRRYDADISSQMWRYTRDRGAVKELVQDVFIEAYQSLPRYRPQAPFLHWLRRIATRVGYRYWKLKAREVRRAAALRDWHETSFPADPDAHTPSEAAERLFGMLEQLAPKDRLVLTLAYFEECDTREIAERTGWNHTLVKVRMHRARQRLRALLEAAGYGRDGDA